MGDTEGKALAVIPQRRIITRVVRVVQQPAPVIPADSCSQADAQRIVTDYSRKQLVSSLDTLVHLRDYSCKDSVRLGATQALIKLALLGDIDSLSDTEVHKLGISTEELSEFLRKVSNVSK